MYRSVTDWTSLSKPSARQAHADSHPQASVQREPYPCFIWTDPFLRQDSSRL